MTINELCIWKATINNPKSTTGIDLKRRNLDCHNCCGAKENSKLYGGNCNKYAPVCPIKQSEYINQYRGTLQ